MRPPQPGSLRLLPQPNPSSPTKFHFCLQDSGAAVQLSSIHAPTKVRSLLHRLCPLSSAPLLRPTLPPLSFGHTATNRRALGSCTRACGRIRRSSALHLVPSLPPIDIHLRRRQPFLQIRAGHAPGPRQAAAHTVRRTLIPVSPHL
jgi:hypothetical protein